MNLIGIIRYTEYGKNSQVLEVADDLIQRIDCKVITGKNITT